MARPQLLIFIAALSMGLTVVVFPERFREMLSPSPSPTANLHFRDDLRLSSRAADVPSSSAAALGGGAPKQQQHHREYPKDGTELGILSTKSPEFFERFQKQVDDMDDAERCDRYGYTFNPQLKRNPRRIFLGALIAEEPWELLEIVSTEAAGIYSGVVLVESNRTQNYTPRQFKHLQHGDIIKKLFKVDKLDIRAFVDENPKLVALHRENVQRNDIMKGWKEMGMRPNDVGLIADMDETFTRDYLRAAQVCNIPQLDYEKHNCYYQKVKISSFSRAFESSPECTLQANGESFGKPPQMFGFQHPDLMIGACIQEIGDPSKHPLPERGPSGKRKEGWTGQNDQDRHLEMEAVEKLIGHRRGGALFDAFDFRQIFGGGGAVTVGQRRIQGYSPYSGFHFHNFFANADQIRFKYRTYGHSDKKAAWKPLRDIAENLAMMHQCVMNTNGIPNQKWVPAAGGFDWFKPNVPIYFQDAEYRARRHTFIREFVSDDDKESTKALKLHEMEEQREKQKKQQQQQQQQQQQKQQKQ